jgi:predicted nucleic acid-binding protein
MLVLVDTNLLLRLVEPAHPHYGIAATATEALETLGHQAVVVPQVVYEFSAVATRPAEVNGLGLPPAETQAKLRGLLSMFHLLRDERRIYEHWHELVGKYEVKGKQVHDARLVAAMLRHDITHLLTFNGADFSRYSEITVIDPVRAGDLAPAK